MIPLPTTKEINSQGGLRMNILQAPCMSSQSTATLLSSCRNIQVRERNFPDLQSQRLCEDPCEVTTTLFLFSREGIQLYSNICHQNSPLKFIGEWYHQPDREFLADNEDMAVNKPISVLEQMHDHVQTAVPG